MICRGHQARQKTLKIPVDALKISWCQQDLMSVIEERLRSANTMTTSSISCFKAEM
jgi:hypothetical protein